MRQLIAIFIILILLTACSIDVSDEPATKPAAIASPLGEPAAPGDGVPSGEEPAWAGLNLSGDLYFVGFINQEHNLIKLDLQSGEHTVIFDPPENAWLTDIAVSPDGSQIAMAYAPPAEEGGVQFGFTDIYLMPADGSAEPTPLLERVEASETYFNLSWPVDDMLYYAHFAPSTDDLGSVLYASQVERLPMPGGQPEVLVKNAAWPRVSKDGVMMAYVTDNNDFILSGVDGSNPSSILSSETFEAVDAPIFQPGSDLICFSAVEPVSPEPLSFWDRLMGVKIAAAHSVPSDWWCMPLDGSGDPERLTNLTAIGLYGDFSPDGRHMAFVTAAGVNVMNPDGSGVFQLLSIPTVGTISWVG